MSAPTAADLAQIPLFASLSPEQLEKFAHRFEVEVVMPGRTLTREGAAGYAFYLLREGSVTVSQQGTDIGKMGPGDFFGEMSILGDGHRTATVTADVETTVWVLFGSSFRELELQSPEITQIIRKAVEARAANFA
jgi:CRP-like cAMP-binding protein